ncbi:MAG: hypothetical protein ACOY4I_13980 [Bacillota bacterium]
MQTGTGAKTAGDWERIADSLETWSCGCTVIGSVSTIHAKCISCGSTFKRVSRKKVSGQKKGKVENLKMELVSKTQTLFADLDIEEKALCQRCDNLREVKVFTQEWDRIKSHLAPCPLCCSQEWLDWSAGKRIMVER